eukprot:6187099-Pleurochrysis_carterae.AAC.2
MESVPSGSGESSSSASGKSAFERTSSHGRSANCARTCSRTASCAFGDDYDGARQQLDRREREPLHRVALGVGAREHAGRVHYLVALHALHHVADEQPARGEGVRVHLGRARRDGLDDGRLAHIGHADEHDERLVHRDSGQPAQPLHHLDEREERLGAGEEGLLHVRDALLGQPRRLVLSLRLGRRRRGLAALAHNRAPQLVKVGEHGALRRLALAHERLERQVGQRRLEGRQRAHVRLVLAQLLAHRHRDIGGEGVDAALRKVGRALLRAAYLEVRLHRVARLGRLLNQARRAFEVDELGELAEPGLVALVVVALGRSGAH